MDKYISFGGLGDSYIVYKKLLEKPANDMDWLHIESNNIVPPLVKEMQENFYSRNIKVSSECDPDYINHFKEGKWNDRIPLNTSVLGDYNFPAIDDGIKKPFEEEYKEDIFDVAIQATGGAKGNRKWQFDPESLIKLLEGKGLRCYLVHSKNTLSQNINSIACSKVYVGLSGFHTYWSLSAKILNVHLEESKDHNHHYIHPEWNKYRYGIKYGSLQEVIKGLRFWDINI